jgi:hypothetical protein
MVELELLLESFQGCVGLYGEGGGKRGLGVELCRVTFCWPLKAPQARSKRKRKVKMHRRTQLYSKLHAKVVRQVHVRL